MNFHKNPHLQKCYIASSHNVWCKNGSIWTKVRIKYRTTNGMAKAGTRYLGQNSSLASRLDKHLGYTAIEISFLATVNICASV